MFISSPGQTYAVSMFVDPIIREFEWSRTMVASLYTADSLTAVATRGCGNERSRPPAGSQADFTSQVTFRRCDMLRPRHFTGGGVMLFGGDDWLALTSELTLEPEIPICDPHHHF